MLNGIGYVYRMANEKLKKVPQEADADSFNIRSKDLLGVT
jgi:hypothetical protein